jgi:2-dehydropantoate 2-reductase
MRIAVFGAGAIGSLVGSLLSGRNEVTLISRQPHAEAVNGHGLIVSGLLEGVYYPKAVTSPNGLEKQDVVLVTVKAYDTPEAARLIHPLVGKDTLVVSLQNGLTNRDVLKRAYGDRTIAALTYLGVTLLSPGKICYAGAGEMIMEGSQQWSDALNSICDALEEAEVRTRIVSDILPEMWLKAIVNSSINPITALTRKKNGCILGDKGLLDISRRLCEEAVAVANAKGIELPTAAPFERVKAAVEASSKNRSSMLQDIEYGRRTELEEITGEIIRQGEEAGMDLPYNRSIYSLVKCAASPG